MGLGLVRLRLPAALVGAACLIGCGAGAPAPIIASVSPARGYTDQGVRLRIRGEGFLPTFRIDQASGARRGDVSHFSGQVGDLMHKVSLTNFDWLDVNEMTAWMAGGLQPGVYDVEIKDPRGQPALLPNGFWALGPDDDQPVVRFERPTADTPIAAGMRVPLALSAWDPEPGSLGALHWEAWAGSGLVRIEPCRFEADRARARCDSHVVVPTWLAAGERLELRAHAVDASNAGNQRTETVSLVVQAPPTVTSIHPLRGGTAGGTDLVITGSGFFPGTQVFLGDVMILPRGGTVLDAQTIIGRAPPRGEGPASVVVRTPIGDAQLPNAFQYESPPQIDSILPEAGNPEGGTAIRVRGHGFTPKTRIFFGATLVGAIPCEEQHYVSDAEISGFAPAGKGSTSVWAFDDELGWTRLTDGFSWRAP
jgi:hypothetical protein